MREAADSAKVREEFQWLAERSRRRATTVDVKTYLQFLTFMSRLSPPPPPRTPIHYPHARL
ncbi:MAG: hypothetical protein A3B78_02535 [Omnitrophica WOR_2 bacterium RIFCSPHIGHO2_02_FULL_67_20]|nr:MAG: hypothetical protein A3B78_02535 [Omnitrophica WOR_2 bacterium RIFCSPHIGHO2_02_FULL_67_20]